MNLIFLNKGPAAKNVGNLNRTKNHSLVGSLNGNKTGKLVIISLKSIA